MDHVNLHSFAWNMNQSMRKNNNTNPPVPTLQVIQEKALHEQNSSRRQQIETMQNFEKPKVDFFSSPYRVMLLGGLAVACILNK